MRLLYKQNDFPIFQNKMYETEVEARHCPKGNISLVENLNTGLIYNLDFQPELMVYDASYQNEQGVSQIFNEHLQEVSHLIKKGMGFGPFIEIGCGKGYFLEMLSTDGVDVMGFDPSYEGDNPKIQARYFASGLTNNISGFILRHVLEHIQDPIAFLHEIKKANHGKGKIYIEVPCFDWICEHRAWFDIFYEHVNYFRLSDFKRIFGENISSGSLFGGQYIYVIADLSNLRVPVISSNELVLFPKDFTDSISKIDRKDSAKVAIWGGASKGVIFSLMNERAGFPIDIVIDMNPAKQGKYLPGAGLRVYSPEYAISMLPKKSTIYVMNSNYLEEIKLMTDNMFNYRGVDCERFSERSV